MTDLIKSFEAEKWAMEPDHLLAFLESIPAVTPEFAAKLESSDITGILDVMSIDDDVASIRIEGPMLKGVPLIFRAFGIAAADMGDIAAAVQVAAEDDSISRIELVIDSPGGTVSGTETLALAVRAAAEAKPVNAIVTGMCASAAYWVAAQATDIAVTESTGIVGSIGTYSTMVDSSEAAQREGYRVHLISSGGVKGQGTGGVPISEEAIAAQQEMINGMTDLFVAGVAAGRDMPEEDVRELATGHVWLAEKAMSLGLVDRVMNAQTTASFAASEPQETAMDADTMKALAAEYPEHKGTIFDGVTAGHSADEIRAQIAEAEEAAKAAQAEAEHLALVERAESAEARAEEAEAKLAKAEAKLDELNALAEGATDPGADGGSVGISTADFLAGKCTPEQVASVVRGETELD